ncbi:MAG: ABC transporter substrate-binding protein [Deinococcales bacterium]
MKKLLAGFGAGALLFGLASVSSAQTNLQTVRIGLGYIPDVQFAPFYTAQEAGLYRNKGLNVTFQHGFTSELYPLLVAGKLDFVVGDAEDVILLRAKDPKAAPLKYVMALYQATPNAILSKRESNIRKFADLKGKRIGVPGKFGSSWTSLQAVLAGANLTEKDVTILETGWTQLEALTANRVDAVMGYINNEAIVAESRGIKLNILVAALVNKSPSNGVIMVDGAIASNIARSFLEASQLGMKSTIENSKQAFEYAKKYVPNMTADRQKVLDASIKFYQSNFSKAKGQGLGFSNPNNWEYAFSLFKSLGRIDKATKYKRSDFMTNALLTQNIQVAAK